MSEHLSQPVSHIGRTLPVGLKSPWKAVVVLKDWAVVKMFWAEVRELHRTDPAEKICCDWANPSAARWMGWRNMVHNMLVEMNRSPHPLRIHLDAATV